MTRPSGGIGFIRECLVYWVGPIIGALLGGFTCQYILSAKKKK